MSDWEFVGADSKSSSVTTSPPVILNVPPRLTYLLYDLFGCQDVV